MKAHSPDYPLIGVLVILLCLGTLILVSVSTVLSQEKFDNPTYFWLHQVKYGLGLGLFLAFLAFILPLSFLKKWAFALFIVNLIAVGLVFAPIIGLQEGAASGWNNYESQKDNQIRHPARKRL